MADKSLIQPGIRDISTEAYNEILDRLGEMDLTSLLVYVVDEVDASALPHLIEQFHVQGVEGANLADTVEKQRTLVKSAIGLHRHKGTKWALEEALKALGITARVKEWFEYAGVPGKFTVEMDLGERGLDLDFIGKVEDTVEEWKNVRSHLEALIVYIESRSSVPKIAGVCLSGEAIIIYPFTQRLIEATGQVPRSIGGSIGRETVTIYTINAEYLPGEWGWRWGQ